MNISSSSNEVQPRRRTPYRLRDKGLSFDVRNVSHPQSTERSASMERTKHGATTELKALISRRASLEPTASLDAAFQASRQASFQGRHSKSFQSSGMTSFEHSLKRVASLETAIHNCLSSKEMKCVSLKPQISSFPASPIRRRASSFVMGNSSKEISSDQKLQSSWLRSQMRLSAQEITANHSVEVAPDSNPRVPLLLDGRFADLARSSNVADALTVRALMIKGVSRFNIAQSGLSLKANKMNWDVLEADRQMPSARKHFKRHCLGDQLCDEDLVQKRYSLP